MHILDIAIILAYLAAVVGAGAWFGRRQETTNRYFFAGQSVPWWAIGASIVATETSTITFISVPGIAFARGGDFTFLQIVFGYVIARVVISIFFMPAYFRKELATVYELLQERFGPAVKGLAATLFVVMRTIADGVRLLLTAIVLAAVFSSMHIVAGTTAISASVIGIGAVMIVFTLMGGMEAVVWVEVVQLAIYIGGALAAAIILVRDIPGGAGAAISLASAHHKFRFLDFALDATKTYTFWAGVFGGCFLTMSTHGTDQYLVQRYLCTDKPRNAAKALLASGVVVLLQFIGFLFIGVLLFAFYRPDLLPNYASLPPSAPFGGADQVFPDFITRHMPTGLSGLVVAAIFAAAMSSSLNSIAATFVADLYSPLVKNRTDKHYLNVSRWLTVLAGILQIGVGLGLMHQNQSALNTALGIASLINGPILGVFLLGWARRGGPLAAFTGMAAGLATVLTVNFATHVAWPWFTLIGSLTTLIVGLIVAQFRFAPLLLLLTMCATVPLPQKHELTLDEKIGQLFVVGARGVFMGESSWAYQQLLHHVHDNHVGGFIWFQSNVYETAMLDRKLNEESKVPLLISADLESGVGMRFLDTTFWPSAMAIAATGDPSLAEQEGRVVAKEAKVLGVNHIFAPVADVNVDPDNPVINTRSFGEDPEDVARYVSAFIRGVQSENVLACAKHFPGHGDTHTDSHRSLPVLDVTRERLERVELVPFRAAIASDVKSVMMGHLAVPSLEDPKLPATVSPKLIGLLRNDLHFDGLIVTDAFDMGGLVENFNAGEAAVRAIEAGEDQVLMSTDTDAAIAAVKAAVASGRLSEARIDESVRRILAAKEFARVVAAHPEEIFTTIDAKEHRVLADTIARRALTLVRGSLPLRVRGKLTLAVVSDFPEVGNPLPDLERELKKRADVQTVLIDSRSTQAEADAILAKKSDYLILAMAVRARSGAGSIAVPQTIRNLTLPPNTIAISFGSPYLLREIPTVSTYLCAYGIQPVMQVAAVHALFGEAKVSGNLPVTIPGFYKRGDGISQ
ncbi:MAG TPA: sodium/solute symporter [Thermoanaerobaculia bacterium]|nr:sodium/solute symporter [Thermoanaerobaculia bacterium]